MVSQEVLQNRVITRLPPGDPVLVALSGGVDSAVAAMLLRHAGHPVTGVTLRLWQFNSTSAAAETDAAAVARYLGIPHEVLDVREAMFRDVIEPFLDDYAAARTPNPCVFCNPLLKYASLLRLADSMGVPWLATGHYAAVGYDPLTGRYWVQRAGSAAKDQSYMLYRLSQDQLARVVFPLSAYSKPDVRRLATKQGLPVAHRGDSQDICFLPDHDYRALLKQYRPESLRPGVLEHVDGRVLGYHTGLPLYTLGQRRGLGVYLPEPVFVAGIDSGSNRLVVGPEASLMHRRVTADRLVFGRLAPGDHPPFRVHAMLRSSMPAQPAIAQVFDGRLTVTFDAPQRAPAPGQSLVCYDDADVMVGGVITGTD